MKQKVRSFLRAVLVTLIAGVIALSLPLLYVCWRLFALIVKAIGVKGMRNVKGNLETPVIFYAHPQTGKRLVLVATVHLADAEYFVILQRLIDSLHDHKVLFEGLGELTPEEWQSLNDKERAIAKQFDHFFGEVLAIAKLLSLQHQRKSLAYSTNWINTDLRMRELVSLFALHDVSIVQVKEDYDDPLDDEQVKPFAKWFLNRLFGSLAPLTVLVKALARLSKRKRLAEELILDARNDVAVRGIAEHAAESHVVAIWGAAHLQGIDKQLKLAGYREVSRQWFRAYRKRKYGLLKIIKEVVNAEATADTSAATTQD